jgi:hypothetical protein
MGKNFLEKEIMKKYRMQVIGSNVEKDLHPDFPSNDTKIP